MKNSILKTTALTLMVGAFFMTTGCTKEESALKVEPQAYTGYGRYYTDGTVITDDGNEWGFSTDAISDRTPYDAMPVWIGFEDNGTPEDITDDIILGLVYDLNTAIYDELEVVLEDNFEIERSGNNLYIGGIK